MQQVIAQELARVGGRSSCVALRLKQPDNTVESLVSLRPALRFPAASLAKVPILVEVSRQVHLGRLNWETRYTVTPEDRVKGSGVLGDLSSQLQPTLYDLAHLMIAISDNTASNVLLSLLGIEAVNETMLHLGLTVTRLERRFMDFAARQAGRDNWTSASDMARLFTLIATELPERERMLAILLRQNDFSLVAGSWGEDMPFAHKTGWLVGLLHDAGILYPPESPLTPLIIIALTDQQADEPLTRYTLARIGRILYRQSGHCDHASLA